MILDLAAAYEILGLPHGAPSKLVQLRYRKLVKAFHPDRFMTLEEKAYAEAKLKQINVAKEVIDQYWRTVKTKPTSADCAAGSAPQKTPPKPAPSQQSVWQALLIAWEAEIEPRLKKLDKKLNVDDALDDYGKPIRLTRDNKKRRFWFAIALFLIFDLLALWRPDEAKKEQVNIDGAATSIASSAASSAREQSLESKQMATQANLMAVPVAAQLAAAQKERQRYFLKLQLDRCALAMRQDIFMAHQIELKLKGAALATSDKRRLEEMKNFHERDWAMQESENNAIMAQLLQLNAS